MPRAQWMGGGRTIVLDHAKAYQNNASATKRSSRGSLPNCTWTWFPKTSEPHLMANPFPRECIPEQPQDYIRVTLLYREDRESRPNIAHIYCPRRDLHQSMPSGFRPSHNPIRESIRMERGLFLIKTNESTHALAERLRKKG